MFTRPRRLFLAPLLLVALAGCAEGFGSGFGTSTKNKVGEVPMFEGLGTNGRKVTTKNAKAQAYFNQGLSFMFAFNHDEAIRSFRRATELDPHCAMAWWGISIASGPHINNPAMSPESSKVAWEALNKARIESKKADETEKSLIGALAFRYADPPPADRGDLDRNYADAMRIAWIKHPNDPDVGALFAEAAMDLRPWNQWTPEGEPQEGTAEVLTTLDRVMQLKPDHPLALHLYIHANEASRDPQRAAAAADRLRDLQPGLGHLVHMPSHIDVRTGKWREAVTANEKAIAADDKYRALSPNQGFYNIYMAHNHQMLSFAAMMIGRRQQAIEEIDKMVAAVPPEFAKQATTMVDGFLAMPLEVRVRFGAWDDILAAPEPEESFRMWRAMRRYARGVALAARGDTQAARAEQAAFATERAAVPAETRLGNNSGKSLLAVADAVLEGEISYREGKKDKAFAALQHAVDLEGKLHYDEPPSWILPARHSLGAALLDAGRAKDAEKVFRDDLEHHPRNGWALFGLARSFRMQGKKADADTADAEFQKAWAGADYQIVSPCACVSGPVASAKR